MSLCGSGTKGSACVDTINNAVGLFNDGLKTLVAQLNKNLIDATFTFINSAGMNRVEHFISRYIYIYIMDLYMCVCECVCD
jgi:hypothetical protein